MLAEHNFKRIEYSNTVLLGSGQFMTMPACLSLDIFTFSQCQRDKMILEDRSTLSKAFYLSVLSGREAVWATIGNGIKIDQ